MANTKESAPDSEEQKFRIKCHDLRKRISEVEESNELATLALSRTRVSIRRLRLEYAVLLERLETQVVKISQNDQTKTHEEMARPYSPALTDEPLDFKPAKAKPAKKKGMSAAALRKAARDPNLPKRPTNAYLMFCDREKERVRADLERENPGKPVTEITRVLTELWKGLSDEDKVPYLKLYEEDRDRYQREMVVYNQRKHDEVMGKKLALKIKISPVLDKAPAKAEEDGADEEDDDATGEADETNFEGDEENLEGDEENLEGDGEEENLEVDDTENDDIVQNAQNENENEESLKRDSASLESLPAEGSGADASKRQKV